MNSNLFLLNIPLRIKSDKLEYRMMNINDTDTVVRLRNANHVRENYIYQKLITEEEHINYFHMQIETGNIVQYVMIIPDTNKIIGCVFLKNIDLENKTAEYGVFIGDIDELGKGYGSDAVRQMIDVAFNDIMLNTLTLKVLSYNNIALNTYKKVGFIEKERIIIDNNESRIREAIIMELVKGRKPS